jgi:MoxR-like ATPase
VQALRTHGYVADRTLATSLHLMLALDQPLLLEGPAGVGKTALANVLSQHLGTELIRLQCYEGLDSAAALYEWDYPKQLLAIRLAEAQPERLTALSNGLFTREYLLERPLLRAITKEPPAPVLLIDEVDRADEEFEAFLLEMLGEFQVTIPELGTLRATERPRVILTSNRTRDLSDALRRRCLYHWVDYPSPEREEAILLARIPELDATLGRQVALFMAQLRDMPLGRAPGVAEALDWARALQLLGRSQLDADTVSTTSGTFLKDQADLEMALSEIDMLLAASRGNQP